MATFLAMFAWYSTLNVASALCYCVQIKNNGDTIIEVNMYV